MDITNFLVGQIKKYRKNLHDNKPRFREGYDKGKHAAYMEVLHLIDKDKLDKIPSAKQLNKE